MKMHLTKMKCGGEMEYFFRAGGVVELQPSFHNLCVVYRKLHFFTRDGRVEEEETSSALDGSFLVAMI